MAKARLDGPILLDHTQAAAWMRNWMRRLGYEDAELVNEGLCPTIRSREAVAQVEWEERPVFLLALQALNGVAAYEQRVPLYFARGGFAHSARRWALCTGIALFQYDALGRVVGIDHLGRRLSRRARSAKGIQVFEC